MSDVKAPAAPSTHSDPTGGDPGPGREPAAPKSPYLSVHAGPAGIHDKVLLEAAALIPQETAPVSGTPETQKPEVGVDIKTTPASGRPEEGGAGGEPDAGPASRGWAAVKEQEKLVRLDRQQLAREKQEFAAAKSAFEKAQAAAPRGSQVSVEDFKADPFGTLERMGVPFAHLADRAIRGDVAAKPRQGQEGQKSVEPAGPESELTKKIEQLQARLDEQEAQRTMAEYTGKVETALAGDQFKLIRAYPGVVDEAVALAVQYAQEYGEVLTPAKALDMLQTEFKEQLSSLRSHEAVREIFGAAAPTQPASTPPAVPNAQPAQPKTLTQSLVSQPAVSKQEERSRPQTETEMLMEAAKLLPPDVWADR